MTCARRLHALHALALAAPVLWLAACAGDSEESAQTATTEPVPTTTAPPAPPPPPPTAVRILDGDTGKPVQEARVDVAGETALADSGGMAEFSVTRKRPKLRVAARGYQPRTVRIDLRQRRVARVELWRPNLQWPMYGVDPGRTQVHRGIKIRPPFRVVWSRRLYGLLEFPAVVWEGVAYINNIRGALRAIDMRTGRLLWKKRIGTLVASSPAIDPDRRVLVVTSMEPGHANVVSMRTGRIRWRYPTGRAEPSPVIRNGIAYFAATNGNVYALDLDRRRPRWIHRGGVKITSSPALVGKRLYVGDYAGRVLALNARTGRRIWTGSAGSRVYGTVAVANGRVFAPSVFSGMSALSARTGRLLWRIPIGRYVYSSPAVFRGRVYFGTYEGLVYCANARTGRVLWTRTAGGGAVSGAVQIVDRVVYASTLRNRMRAWHWRSGKTLWSFPQGEYVPVSGNGSRLLLHGWGRIWAVVPKRKKR